MAPAITEYVGQRVEITFNPDALEDENDPVTQIIGKVENANAVGFVFKPAGSSKSRLYQAGDVEDIRMAPEAEPVLRARRLDPANLKNVKRHLVDRHAYGLDDINAMSPEDALEFHDNSIDHDPLGHFHALPKPKAEKAAEKVEAPDAEELQGSDANGDVGVVFSDDEEDEPDF